MNDFKNFMEVFTEAGSSTSHVMFDGFSADPSKVKFT